MARMYRCPEERDGVQCFRYTLVLGEPSDDAVRCNADEHNFTPPRAGRVGQQKQEKAA